MSVLDQLLVFAFMTGAVASFIGDRRFAGTLLAILYFGQFLLLVKLAPLGYGAQPVVSAWQPALFGEVLVWRMDALGWYFALITVVAGWLVTWYASGEWGQGYRERGGNLGLMHTAVAANVVAMLLLLSSGNLSFVKGQKIIFGHINFTTNFQNIRPPCSMKLKWNLINGLKIFRYIFACFAVTTCQALNKRTLFISEGC